MTKVLTVDESGFGKGIGKVSNSQLKSGSGSKKDLDSKKAFPQATPDEMRIAQLLSTNRDEEAILKEKINKVIEATKCQEEMAIYVLYDANGDVERAVNLVMDCSASNDIQWQVSVSHKHHTSTTSTTNIPAKKALEEEDELQKQQANMPAEQQDSFQSRGGRGSGNFRFNAGGRGSGSGRGSNFGGGTRRARDKRSQEASPCGGDNVPTSDEWGMNENTEWLNSQSANDNDGNLNADSSGETGGWGNQSSSNRGEFYGRRRGSGGRRGAGRGMRFFRGRGGFHGSRIEGGENCSGSGAGFENAMDDPKSSEFSKKHLGEDGWDDAGDLESPCNWTGESLEFVNSKVSEVTPPSTNIGIVDCDPEVSSNIVAAPVNDWGSSEDGDATWNCNTTATNKEWTTNDSKLESLEFSRSNFNEQATEAIKTSLGINSPTSQHDKAANNCYTQNLGVPPQVCNDVVLEGIEMAANSILCYDVRHVVSKPPPPSKIPDKPVELPLFLTCGQHPGNICNGEFKFGELSPACLKNFHNFMNAKAESPTPGANNSIVQPSALHVVEQTQVEVSNASTQHTVERFTFTEPPSNISPVSLVVNNSGRVLSSSEQQHSHQLPQPSFSGVFESTSNIQQQHSSIPSNFLNSSTTSATHYKTPMLAQESRSSPVHNETSQQQIPTAPQVNHVSSVVSTVSQQQQSSNGSPLNSSLSSHDTTQQLSTSLNSSLNLPVSGTSNLMSNTAVSTTTLTRPLSLPPTNTSNNTISLQQHHGRTPTVVPPGIMNQSTGTTVQQGSSSYLRQQQVDYEYLPYPNSTADLVHGNSGNVGSNSAFDNQGRMQHSLTGQHYLQQHHQHQNMLNMQSPVITASIAIPTMQDHVILTNSSVNASLKNSGVQQLNSNLQHHSDLMSQQQPPNVTMTPANITQLPGSVTAAATGTGTQQMQFIHTQMINPGGTSHQYYFPSGSHHYTGLGQQTGANNSPSGATAIFPHHFVAPAQQHQGGVNSQQQKLYDASGMSQGMSNQQQRYSAPSYMNNQDMESELANRMQSVGKPDMNTGYNTVGNKQQQTPVVSGNMYSAGASNVPSMNAPRGGAGGSVNHVQPQAVAQQQVQVQQDSNAAMNALQSSFVSPMQLQAFLSTPQGIALAMHIQQQYGWHHGGGGSGQPGGTVSQQQQSGVPQDYSNKSSLVSGSAKLQYNNNNSATNNPGSSTTNYWQ